MQIIFSSGAIFENKPFCLIFSLPVSLFFLSGRGKKSQPQAGTSLEQINFWTKEFNLLQVASIESKAWAMRSAS